MPQHGPRVHSQVTGTSPALALSASGSQQSITAQQIPATNKFCAAFSLTKRTAIHVTTAFSAIIASIIGAFLLWRYSPLPLGAIDLFFYLQILAAPIAVLLGLISLWMHHTVLHDLRYIAFALALSYTTQSSYSVGVFRTSSPVSYTHLTLPTIYSV